MAAGFLNHLAHPERTQAISAGTQPSATIHFTVEEVMLEIGFVLAGEPRLLTKELAQETSLLVTMGCSKACPVVPGLERMDWPIPDPKRRLIDEVRNIRDVIKYQVGALILEHGWDRP